MRLEDTFLPLTQLLFENSKQKQNTTHGSQSIAFFRRDRLLWPLFDHGQFDIAHESAPIFFSDGQTFFLFSFIYRHFHKRNISIFAIYCDVIQVSVFTLVYLFFFFPAYFILKISTQAATLTNGLTDVTNNKHIIVLWGLSSHNFSKYIFPAYVCTKHTKLYGLE